MSVIAPRLPAHGREERIPTGGCHAAILATVVTVSVFAMTLGLTYPLFALLLKDWGASSQMIGASAAMTPLGVVVSAPLVPALVGRFGSYRCAVLCLAGTAMLFLAAATLAVPGATLPLRFLLGVFVNLLFVLSENWLNLWATDANRGRVMGLYSMVMAAGFAIGPLLLAGLGPSSSTFLIAAALAIAGLLPLARARGQVPDMAPERTGAIWAFVPRAPTLVLAVGAFAFFDAAVLTFLPLLMLAGGHDPAFASAMISVVVLGSIVWQVPLGWAADRSSPRAMLIACAGGAALGCAAIPASMHEPNALYLVLFAWGGLAFGIYTMALAELGQRFTGSLLFTGNAMLGLMFGVGGLLGAPATGVAFEQFGAVGMAAVTGGMFVGVAVVAAARARLKAERSPAT